MEGMRVPLYIQHKIKVRILISISSKYGYGIEDGLYYFYVLTSLLGKDQNEPGVRQFMKIFSL